MVFPICIHGDRTVYMKGYENSESCIITISSQKLIKVWAKYQMNDRSKEKWYVDKYTSADQCFDQSKQFPVSLAECGEYFNFEMCQHDDISSLLGFTEEEIPCLLGQPWPELVDWPWPWRKF